jgi:hypothetical protein
MDLGAPASYMTLPKGTPVFASGGDRVGVVAHVLADANADIFDGIVIDTGSGHRFADAPEVDRIHENGVVLTLDLRAASDLPEPSSNPASMRASPDDVTHHDLGDKLRRAWDLVSGRY